MATTMQQQPSIMVPVHSPPPPPPPMSHTSTLCFKISIVILGSLGLIFYITTTVVCSIYSFESIRLTPHVHAVMIVILNMSYTLSTCRIIYTIFSDTFPSPGDLRDLRSNVAQFTATTIFGFGLFIAVSSWYSMYDDTDGYNPVSKNFFYTNANATNFGCSFPVFWNIVVVALAGAYWRVCTRQMKSRAIMQRQVVLSPSLAAAAQGAQQYPAAAQGVQLFPAAAQGVQQYPAAAQEVQLFPAAAQGVQQYPAAAQGVQLFPAAAEATPQIPTAAQGAQQFPAVAQGTQQFPAFAQGAQQFPAAAQGRQQFPVDGNYMLSAMPQQQDAGRKSPLPVAYATPSVSPAPSGHSNLDSTFPDPEDMSTEIDIGKPSKITDL